MPSSPFPKPISLTFLRLMWRDREGPKLYKGPTAPFEPSPGDLWWIDQVVLKLEDDGRWVLNGLAEKEENPEEPLP